MEPLCSGVYTLNLECNRDSFLSTHKGKPWRRSKWEIVMDSLPYAYFGNPKRLIFMIRIIICSCCSIGLEIVLIEFSNCIS